MAGVNKATVLIVVRHFSDTRGARELFLGLARLGAASHFALGHVAGEAANVVLQDLVLVLVNYSVEISEFHAISMQIPC